MLDDSSEYKLSVDRTTPDKLWQSAVCFYKSAKLKPHKLRKELVIEFDKSGEVGADSGALRREFFEDALRQADIHLFEGEDARRVMKKDWGMELLYEVAGMLICHSILQEGPGLPCLSPATFDYISNSDNCCPLKDDIPLNIATHELITFIEMLNDASTEDEVDDILDNPSYAYILKSCGWCNTKPITLSNKMQFLQHLVQDEVIAKRERNMKAFVRGLDYLEFGELVRQHPEMTRSLFVAAQSGTILAKVFLSLISANRPESKEHARAFDYFKEFIAYLEGEGTDLSLPMLLRFITGSSSVPPLGLQCPIVLSYLPSLENAVLPTAQACFSRLMLPVVHACKDAFFTSFVTALQYGDSYGSV